MGAEGGAQLAGRPLVVRTVAAVEDQLAQQHAGRTGRPGVVDPEHHEPGTGGEHGPAAAFGHLLRRAQLVESPGGGRPNRVPRLGSAGNGRQHDLGERGLHHHLAGAVQTGHVRTGRSGGEDRPAEGRQPVHPGAGTPGEQLDVLVRCTTEFTTTAGDDEALVIGDGNDADGFLVLDHTDLTTTYNEAVTGHAAGWLGKIEANVGVYFDPDGTDGFHNNTFVYAPSGAAETIDWALTCTGNDCTAGAATIYVIYTRIQ